MAGDMDDVSGAFAALADETRVEILEALVDARIEDPEDPGLSFSDLRSHVGIEDSGRFNYHLGKLRGRFVEETDGGYELTYAGGEVVGAILSGTPNPDLVLESKTLDDRCPVCDGEMTGSYDNGAVRVECENGHTPVYTTVPPAAAADRSIQELLSVTARSTFARFELVTDGVCHECFGRLDRWVEPTAEVDSISYALRTLCERCGTSSFSALGAAILRHPAFVAFCHDHGLAVRDMLPWQLPGLVDGDTERIQTDPDRYRIHVDIADERLSVTVDDTGEVLDTERTTPPDV